MDVEKVPGQLAERLGPEGTAGLVRVLNEAFEDQRERWSEQVLSLAAERFERRLSEETSKLRVEMAQGFASVRQEMSAHREALREQISGQGGALRQEMGALRQDMANLEVRLFREMSANRVEALRWSFAFWIGQLVAMAGLLAFMLRGVRG